jgi:hypothetical protein
MSWFAVGAAVASAVVSQYNANKVAKKQNQATVASIQEQAKLQREANQAVNQNIDKLAQSDAQDEYQGRSGDIRNQLRQKQAMALAGIQNPGGGEAVTEMANAARPQAVGYGDDINSWISGIDAPMLQRQGEGWDRADVESRLGLLRRNSAQEDAMLRLKLAGIRPNPWLNMLSEGLSAYAGAKGFGGGNTMSGGASGATTNPMISATSSQTLPGMTPDYSSIYGQPGKFGMFKW